MEIVVIRAPGNIQGEDIIEPLLSTEQAGVSRGRAELDARSTVMEEVQMDVVYRANLVPGQLVKVVDALQGTAWYGKIKAVQHRINNAASPSVISSLTIEHPTDFVVP